MLKQRDILDNSKHVGVYSNRETNLTVPAFVAAAGKTSTSLRSNRELLLIQVLNMRVHLRSPCQAFHRIVLFPRL